MWLLGVICGVVFCDDAEVSVFKLCFSLVLWLLRVASGNLFLMIGFQFGAFVDLISVGLFIGYEIVVCRVLGLSLLFCLIELLFKHFCVEVFAECLIQVVLLTRYEVGV